MQNKVVVPGKVKKDKDNNKKYKIEKDKVSESDITIDIVDDGDYDVEKLSVEGLPANMVDGNPITWINNFSIKKNGQYINQRFFVTIPNIGSSKLIIFDGNGNPYYYTGEIKNNRFELTDGDPAIGHWP
ncbi:MAG TPA: hypothetical protein PKE35_06485 [Anaerolineales bacterium]|nr:hypothetical protein [Anaerolineales bacterium]HMV96557.1 hypothetical protein [Anaerolineales bacterium]HMX19441.1 hypothetical protein [Anaerolineales bacterium]HMX73878.1 hypothetical protein [Anaerolineales bacterium]HMZ41924.1 hypothetical protein [Anaerolineales bacterium]